MTDNYFTKWNAWTVEPENLPAFLDVLWNSDAGLSISHSYARQIGVHAQKDGSFLVVAQCVDVPYVKNKLNKLTGTTNKLLTTTNISSRDTP